MSLTSTTLSADVDARTLRFPVTASTGATVGGFMRVDDEYMMLEKVSTGLVEVRARGDRGGTAVAHDTLAFVTFGLASDMVALPARQDIPVPGNRYDLKHVGEDGAIAVPLRDTIYFINKATAAALTLADPKADQDGLQVSFVGTTDAAHVITAVTVYDSSSADIHTVLTSAAYAGSSLTLIAHAGTWLVLANQLWVITVP
jgi:hypothetical protein